MNSWTNPGESREARNAPPTEKLRRIVFALGMIGALATLPHSSEIAARTVNIAATILPDNPDCSTGSSKTMLPGETVWRIASDVAKKADMSTGDVEAEMAKYNPGINLNSVPAGTQIIIVDCGEA